MTMQVLMPKVGLTMTEGKIVEWKKQEGDRVEKGEILFVFETEKVSFEVEAAHSGYLARILKQVDETVQVGEVVGLLTESEGEKIRATPMARRIAREQGVDLKNVSAPSSQGAPEEAEGRLVKLSQMRKVIAEKMMAGKRETAQIYMTVSIDATKLLETRERLAPVLEKSEGVRPTITDLLMKIGASAVKCQPILNTRWTSDGIV